MAKALLINPSYYDSYGTAKAAIVDPVYPTLSILTVAAGAEKAGHQIEILDLSYRQYDYQMVMDKIKDFKPDVVGITATTPLMNQLRDISVLTKSVSKDIRVIAGGSHVSALPKESIMESMIDIVVVGEGDTTLAEVLDGNALKNIRGIFYRNGNDIIETPSRPFVQDLDSLPMPAWHLYDAQEYKYKISRLLARRRPLAMAEFSRGCIYTCDFCASKNTMALGYRKKSPERCAEEVKLMYKYGYREFALADDIFTSDNKWAKSVSEAISKTGVDMLWTCTNGIRVESCDKELFRAMRKAGCYRVSFGFESGNDKVLKDFGKGGKACLDKGVEAVRMAREAKIDTSGFFMLGLSPDTEKTMRDTINYAKRLPLDMMKFGIAIGFPGTKMFNEYRKKGMVKTYNWDDYFIYTTQPLFNHDHLSFQKVQEYMETAYNEAIFRNPRFMWRRFIRGVKTFEFFWDAYYFLKILLNSSVNTSTGTAKYFDRSGWPNYDFENNSIRILPYRRANEKGSGKQTEVVEI